MKLVIIIAIAVVLLIPVYAFADEFPYKFNRENFCPIRVRV